MNTIQCVKLNKELEALERAPYPGERLILYYH
jgi:Fe-S cluster biosynthesis and repair protein YggX